ncbi:Glycoside hydrolase family 18 protein [Pyrenophora teres f. maculata]|nr:Glycoside hydrolase family 18 protein [Pyrenophora teres f. maculata]
MRYSSTAALLSLASLGQASPAPHVHQHAHAARDLVGLGSLGSQYQAGVYFTNWGIYARNYTVSDLPIDRLTYVNYAFANVNRTTGEVFLSDEWSDIQRPYPTDVATNGSQLLGNFNQLYKAKQKNRNLKVILGVGGWTWRFNFSPALSTRAGRVNYCKSSLKLITDLGIDGLDTDWEYVANEVEAANLLDTMQTCRQMFDEYSKKYTKGYHYELSISAPAGPQHYSKLNIKELDRYIDRWNLMAFDYQGGGFSNYTGHLSNVYASTTNPRSTDGWVNETQSFAPFNTKAAIDYYKTRVASPSKITLGMPLYGRSFANVVDLSRGAGAMGQKFNGSGEGTWEAGNLDYKVLPQNGTKMFTDRSVLASWSWDAVKKQIVSFDTPEVAKWKTDFLKTECLGGAWFWEASGDAPVSSPKSIVATVVNELGGAQSLKKNQNNLHYPTSKYYNIKHARN